VFLRAFAVYDAQLLLHPITALKVSIPPYIHIYVRTCP